MHYFIIFNLNLKGSIKLLTTMVMAAVRQVSVPKNCVCFWSTSVVTLEDGDKLKTKIFFWALCFCKFFQSQRKQTGSLKKERTNKTLLVQYEFCRRKQCSMCPALSFMTNNVNKSTGISKELSCMKASAFNHCGPRGLFERGFVRIYWWNDNEPYFPDCKLNQSISCVCRTEGIFTFI